MAATPRRSPNRSRPGRTLTHFLAAIIALYGLVALVDGAAKRAQPSRTPRSQRGKSGS